MTEEGKRTCSFADRPILEALRLPSFVTLPPKLDRIKSEPFTDRLYKDKQHNRQCATFSSGEGFWHSARPYVLGKAALFILPFY
ncbi:MAG: hypothetical protein II517_00320, partial [Ruminococcus sp.]|nr:hypothetical protein [Ruminococcus sp.]